MFNWLREILEIQHEFRERKIRTQLDTEENKNKCESCEVLKHALERANFEKDKLLETLLKPNEPIKQEIIVPKPIAPKNIPWNVRRNMLEHEDREKAKLMREAPKADIAEFEQELKDAESARSASPTSTTQSKTTIS